MNCYSVFLTLMWILCYAMMPYCHRRHTPLGLYYARESWECDTEAKGGNAKKKKKKKKKKSALPPLGNTIQNRQFRLRECYQNFTSPQAEIWYLFRFTVPFTEMHIKIFIPPRGNTIWDWQFRLRGCNQNIAFPRAEIISRRCKQKIYIPPSREYDPESTVPLAGMQSKFYIPASGDFVFISVHGPRERRCT